MTLGKKVAALLAVVALTAGSLALYGAAEKKHGRGGHSGQRLELIATYLDLTEAQKTQAKSLLESAKTQAAPYMQQLRENHKAMVEAVKANRPETDLKQLADTQGSAVANLALIKAKTGEQLYSMLSPEQKEKADKLHNHFMNMLGQRFGKF